MATHIYTSVAANYLPKARVLAGSLKRFHPEFQFHVVLCDAVPEGFSLDREPFDSLLTLHDLGLENPEQWIFKHTLIELSTAVKGFALEKLLALPGCTEVLFFDPDVVVLSPLDGLLAEFASASILLTPHLAQPETTQEAIVDNEISALQHGIYNLGFLGIKNSAEGRRFATWWSARLKEFCYDDIARGVFTDQRWADLTPAYFADHKILRDPAYNVCTWNLSQRTVTGSAPSGLLVNGEPLVFYHFSGFDSGAQQGMLDKYGAQMPALYELREWYIAECERQGQNELSGVRWAYGFFENGEPILNVHRKRYREQGDLQAAFPNPFLTRDVSRSYLHWFNRNDDAQIAIKASDSIDFPATPEYRVFVLARHGDAAFLQETLDRVHERTSPGHEILVIEGESYDGLFESVLRRFGDKDALLIRAGAIPPDMWDLRLAWSAVRQPGIATVSPVDERLLDPSGRLRSGGADDLLDRLCYSHRQPADVEVASFSRDCVYVRAEARSTILLKEAARLRYSHVLATHVCMGMRRPREIGPPSISPSAVERLQDRIRAHESANCAYLPQVVKCMTGANLHIVHSWGGGVEEWVAEYCRADRVHDNLVLKSFGEFGAFGSELHLYRHIDDPKPLAVWPLEPAIKATATSHSRYAAVLPEILRQHNIQRIVVSSLIGHSLEALRQPVATLFICHDYYPFCPACNITFDGVCRSCEETRLVSCIENNPHNRFFPNVPPSEWLHIRSEFARAVKHNGVKLIAPSPSVRDHYARLCPDLATSFRVIPHGTGALAAHGIEPEFEHEGPLQVLILGNLAPHKGGLLLECIVPELLRFARITLLGCGDYGRPYADNPKITVAPHYKRDQLPKLLGDLKPDLGLLLSVVPETFSYTLRELQDLRVPVLASDIGSFADRIEDGITGLLCAPEPAAIVQRLRDVDGDRQILRRIHENLKRLESSGVEAMLRAYEDLDPTRYLPRKYFAPSTAAEVLAEKRLQLFWRTASGSFEESDSVSAAPLGRERQIVRLYFLAPAEPIEQLRLDLSDEPGLFLLYDLVLRDRDGGVVWNWKHDLAGLESTFHKDISFFESGSGSHALLYFSGGDPYLLLPIEAGDLQSLKGGGCVEIDFGLPLPEDCVTAMLASAQTPERARVQAELRAGIEREKVLTREREARVHELETAIAAVEDSLSWRLTRPMRAVAALGRSFLRRPH